MRQKTNPKGVSIRKLIAVLSVLIMLVVVAAYLTGRLTSADVQSQATRDRETLSVVYARNGEVFLIELTEARPPNEYVIKLTSTGITVTGTGVSVVAQILHP